MSEIVKPIIDLNQVGKPLSEAIYTDFANNVRDMMLDLYGMGIPLPVSLKGSSTQIDSFMKTLRSEKRYMDSYTRHGLNNPNTLRSKHDLSRAVEKFEKETGLRWPFKN
tara:strand:- start:159 stop:485 length:327 start_codon:yes stop_codon:yes gene_type:complete